MVWKLAFLFSNQNNTKVKPLACHETMQKKDKNRKKNILLVTVTTSNGERGREREREKECERERDGGVGVHGIFSNRYVIK